MLALYEHPSNKNARPSSITGSIVKTPITGVDASTSFTLNFTEHLRAQAILSCSMTVPSAHFGATIRYKNGNVLVKAPIYRPPAFTVQYYDKPGGDVVREETKAFKYVGGGWHYEADEVARCIRDGKLESDLWGHEKSIIMMEVFDEVGTSIPPNSMLLKNFQRRFAGKDNTFFQRASRRSKECSEMLETCILQ